MYPPRLIPALRVALFLCCAFALSVRAATPTPPNIVLIFIDDLGYGDIGPFGSTLNRTTHLDRMAREGTRYTQAFCGTTVCAPSRASLMTGRLPSAHGVQMNGRELSLGESTFVEQLRLAGWHTALVGKAHLQNITAVPPPWPAASTYRPNYFRVCGDSSKRWPGPKLPRQAVCANGSTASIPPCSC